MIIIILYLLTKSRYVGFFLQKNLGFENLILCFIIRKENEIVAVLRNHLLIGLSQYLSQEIVKFYFQQNDKYILELLEFYVCR